MVDGAVTTNEAQLGAATASSDVSKNGKDTLQQQSISRLAAARIWKNYIELDVKECYFFTFPDRQRQISSMTAPSQARMLDAPELNTDDPFIITEDFCTEIVNAFMPEALPWCERGKGTDVAQADWDKVKDQVKADDEAIFEAMKATNLYPELPKAFNPDLAIGTAALWIDRPAGTMNAPVVSAVPFRELEIDLGPYGEIDYRAAVRFVRNHAIRELLGEEVWAKVPKELVNKQERMPSDRTQIVWAFWRDWQEKHDVVWQHTIMIGSTMVHDQRFEGEGSCPLLPMRFGATADWPHGLGPTRKSLPTYRQIDELDAMRIENAALSIKPPITYPDDSFAAVEQGVEEGMAYPVRPGSAADVKAIYTPPPPEVANFQYEEKLKKVRKLHFVDYPEQSGDTPPTLGQWLDEMARAQRRVGMPGLSFWREGPLQVFLRFKHLLEVAGKIMPLKVDGRTVATLPRNPAQAAAEQQEVGMAIKASQYLAATFPEEWKMYVDGQATMKAVLAKMRVSLIKMRDPAQVQEAVKQMSQLVGARPQQLGGLSQGTPGPAA
jgi:head-to-tail connecting protein